MTSTEQKQIFIDECKAFGQHLTLSVIKTLEDSTDEELLKYSILSPAVVYKLAAIVFIEQRKLRK